MAQLRQQLTGCGASLAIAPASLLGFLTEAAAGVDRLKMSGTLADFMALPTMGADLKPFAADEPGYLQFSSGSTRFPKGIEIHQKVLMANAYAITHYGLDITEKDRTRHLRASSSRGAPDQPPSSSRKLSRQRAISYSTSLSYIRRQRDRRSFAGM